MWKVSHRDAMWKCINHAMRPYRRKDFGLWKKRMRTIYTDGSCLWNPWPWWWAVIIQSPKDTNQEVIWTWWKSLTTNNVMELTAAIKALQWLWEKYTSQRWWRGDEDVQEWFFASWLTREVVLISDPIVLITDSSYVKLGITEWMVTRKRRQRRRAKWGKLVENVALRKELDALVSCFSHLTWQWTKAHVGTEMNERVDILARKEAEKR